MSFRPIDLVPQAEFARRHNLRPKLLWAWATEGRCGVLLRRHPVGGRVYISEADFAEWNRQVALARVRVDRRFKRSPPPDRERERRVNEALRRHGFKV